MKYLDGTVKCELVDILYNGESVVDLLEETDEDILLPASIFGDASGRQYLSYIFMGDDEALHEVKVYYYLVNSSEA